MLKWFKKVLGIERSGLSGREESGETGAEEGEFSNKGHVLFTRRCSNPMEDIAGFPEVYFCTTCGDRFVLAWHPRNSPFARSFQKVARSVLSAGADNIDRLPVFCPACRTEYPQYGEIPWPGIGAQRMNVLACFSVVYPAGAHIESVRRNPIPLIGVPVEKIVVVLSGKLPEGLDTSGFVGSFLDRALGRELDPVRAGGGVLVQVVQVDQICDETLVVMDMLAENVYKREETGIRTCITGPVIPLKPPLKQMMLCMVHPPTSA